jgi:hypothetical protein
MNIINKFRSKEKVNIETTNGHKITINPNTIGVELDCKVKIFFTKGAEQYYRFMQNPYYYQTNEVKFINILRDPDAVIDTVDDLIYEGDRIYSVLILDDIAFLMLDEEG